MTGRSSLFLILALIHLAFVACSSDSDNGGGNSDTSGTSGSDTSGTSNTDTQSTADTGTSGADTSGSVTLEPCNVTPPAATKTQLSYADDILPLLRDKTCLDVGCHTPFNGVSAGGLDLSTLGQGSIPSGTAGPAYVACDPANSNLIIYTYPGCVDALPEAKRMPQSISEPALTEAEAALLYQWIAEGGEATFNAATCPE